MSACPDCTLAYPPPTPHFLFMLMSLFCISQGHSLCFHRSLPQSPCTLSLLAILIYQGVHHCTKVLPTVRVVIPPPGNSRCLPARPINIVSLTIISSSQCVSLEVVTAVNKSQMFHHSHSSSHSSILFTFSHLSFPISIFLSPLFPHHKVRHLRLWQQWTNSVCLIAIDGHSFYSSCCSLDFLLSCPQSPAENLDLL